MTDPTFKDRAGLGAWLSDARSHFNHLLAFGYPHRTTEQRIKRVRAAHAHLIEETPHGR